jgi:peroxiredoxin
MSASWQVVVVALWLVAIVQLFLILVLYRQFGLVYLGRGEARSRDGLPLRTRAPSWRALDQDGQERSAEEFIGRPQLIAFTDANCSPCQQLMPELAAYYRETLDDVHVIVIGTDDSFLNEAMAERYGLEMPVLTQHEDEVSGQFRVTATPFVFVVDAEGAIREKGIVNHRDQIVEKMRAVIHPRAREEMVA